MVRLIPFLALSVALSTTATADISKYTFTAGHPSLQEWLLPAEPPYPANNAPTAARIDLGHRLFFDPRLSGDGTISCATCHHPSLGWSDAQPTARGVGGQRLGRASPTVINTAYNPILMWDGRNRSLEEQAVGPMASAEEMGTDFSRLVKWLNSSAGYRDLFALAYPQEPITEQTVAKALAAYQRTVISNNSPFDLWVKGDASAMTPQQVNGFQLFIGKANCAVCHSAPNFTDHGFHNVGLAAWGKPDPDMGRFGVRPLPLMRGAFKTPTLRDIERTAPYFHDGSAATLMEVVEHYVVGGEVKSNLSPNMRALELSESEKGDLVAFMRALTSPWVAVALPELPTDVLVDHTVMVPLGH
jgi:cytochrome c peroxidase